MVNILLARPLIGPTSYLGIVTPLPVHTQDRYVIKGMLEVHVTDSSLCLFCKEEDGISVLQGVEMVHTYCASMKLMIMVMLLLMHVKEDMR